jgi:hypothetical protein
MIETISKPLAIRFERPYIVGILVVAAGICGFHAGEL